MDCIDWLNGQIDGLQSQIETLKAQRTILQNAMKALDEPVKVVWATAETSMPEAIKPSKAAKVSITAPRKPRTGGVKDAVVECLKSHIYGVKSADIIAALPNIESGSIRQALNGLKKKGAIMQDGKMWMMANSAYNFANNTHDGEEMTA